MSNLLTTANPHNSLTGSMGFNLNQMRLNCADLRLHNFLFKTNLNQGEESGGFLAYSLTPHASTPVFPHLPVCY